MSQIQQIQLTLPVVDPNTGLITEYGRQVLSDFLISQTNQNTDDIAGLDELNSLPAVPQPDRQLDLNFGIVSPVTQQQIQEEAPETVLPQFTADPAELVGLIYSLQQEVLLLRQRVEDLENGS